MAAAFLAGDGPRQRVEAAPTKAPNRPTTISALRFSPLAGSAVARNLCIADDARFGPEPFVEAAQVRLGLELWPLLLHREVRIGSIALQTPSIRLLRNGYGTWNYASLGNRDHGRAVSGAPRNATLAISRIAVSGGRVLVRTAAAGAATATPQGTQDRLYDHVDIAVNDLRMDRAFPVHLGAKLPGGGTLEAAGAVGPWNRLMPAATHVAGNVRVTHLDLAAAGLVRSTSPVAAVLETATAELAWGADGLDVAALTASAPELRNAPSAAAAPGPHTPSAWGSLLDRLRVDRADVNVGMLTFQRRDGRTVLVRDAQVTLNGWTPTAPAHFAVAASVGGGAVHAAGSFSLPRVTGSTRSLHITSQLMLRRVDLSSSGLLSPGSAVRGVADADVHLASADGVRSASGTARLDRLVLARTGQPAPGPVLVSFRVAAKPDADGLLSGQVEAADLSFGGSVVHVDGAWVAGGPAPLLRLHCTGTALPIDGVESYLPAAGVQMPEGSRLHGGLLSFDLGLTGTPADLSLDGPVSVEATRLAGFDLGGRLATLSRWTGGRLGSSGSTGTELRALSFRLHGGGGAVMANDIAANVVGIGRITGAGTVGAGGSLQFALLLRLEEMTAGTGGGANLARGLAGALPGNWAARALGVVNALANGPMRNGIPLSVTGTAHHPVVTPNLNALFAPAPRQPAPPSPWVQPKSAWPGTPTAR